MNQGVPDDEINPVVDAIRQLTQRKSPVVVAVDGRSGTGKSTLSARMAAQFGAALIDQDDFYSGGDFDDWMPLTPEQRADRCIDWRRLRQEVLEPLITGHSARWHPFDWDTLNGLAKCELQAEPSEVIVLDGAYSSRQELSDVINLTVLVTLPEEVRRRRLVDREGAEWMTTWHRVWDEAEDHYFSRMRPPGQFDIVIQRH